MISKRSFCYRQIRIGHQSEIFDVPSYINKTTTLHPVGVFKNSTGTSNILLCTWLWNYLVNAYSTAYKNNERGAGGPNYCILMSAILALVLAKMQFHLNIVQVDCFLALSL